MPRLIAAFGIRFTIGAAIYLITVSGWIGRARGLESVGLFGQAVIFGCIAALAWIVAVVVSRRIGNRWLRLAVHAPLTVLLFVVLGYLIAGVLMDVRSGLMNDMAPYVGLIAFVGLIDTLVGHLLDDWVLQRRRAA